MEPNVENLNPDECIEAYKRLKKEDRELIDKLNINFEIENALRNQYKRITGNELKG